MHMPTIINSRVYQLASQNIIFTTILAAAFIGTLTAYGNSKRKQRFWTKRGLRGPKPMVFIGNFFSQLLGNRLDKELEWVKRYGKVYGVFEGNTPRLIVADAEILRQICIKDFGIFTNHDRSDFAHKYSNTFLVSLQDKHWKLTRALLTPTFTSSKIKRMFHFLDGCCDDMVQCFREQLAIVQSKSEHETQKAKVNVKDLYSLFTMDAITTCCYGLKLERAGSSNLKMAASRDEFVANAMKMFDANTLRVFMTATFPRSILKLLNFKTVPDSQMDPLAKKVQQLISKRKGSQKKFDDYLQLLIDARLGDQLELNEMDRAENHHAGLTHESLLKDQRELISGLAANGQEEEVGVEGGGGSGMKVTLTDFEILSSAMFLIVVGLETTGSLLAHCTYALAFHPEIQDRLYDELMKIAHFDADKRKFKFEYDTITSCKYLDACLSEALRILPPIVQIDRKSSEEYYLEKYNLRLPKGTKINLAYHAILNDPDYWTEPEIFNPDRFMPDEREKIVPGAYCPFGLGPRHCLGMRFSLTEAKLALAKMMVNYRFEPAPGTKFPPEPQVKIYRESNSIGGGLKTPLVTICERADEFWKVH